MPFIREKAIEVEKKEGENFFSLLLTNIMLWILMRKRVCMYRERETFTSSSLNGHHQVIVVFKKKIRAREKEASINRWAVHHLKRFLPLDWSSLFQFFWSLATWRTYMSLSGFPIENSNFLFCKFNNPFPRPHPAFILKSIKNCQLCTNVQTSALKFGLFDLIWILKKL